jgi:AraC-like DNA-binding protein
VRSGTDVIAENLANIVFERAQPACRVGLGRACQVGEIYTQDVNQHVQIGKALTRMHADVAKKWKVEHLASEVGMSRTTFSERFKALVGVPPLEYLIHWRMMIARDALKNGRDTLSDIAMRVGYASETSFSAAFKNAFGQSPGRLRSLIRSENAHQLRDKDGTLETF